MKRTTEELIFNFLNQFIINKTFCSNGETVRQT